MVQKEEGSPLSSDRSTGGLKCPGNRGRKKSQNHFVHQQVGGEASYKGGWKPGGGEISGGGGVGGGGGGR